jgi:hypothetical protein
VSPNRSPWFSLGYLLMIAVIVVMIVLLVLLVAQVQPSTLTTWQMIRH